MTTRLEHLLAALKGIPRLPGAACAEGGRWFAFDPPHHDETAADVAYRHQVALRICQSCPVLADCKSWVDSLPRSRRPRGVIAGRIVNEPRPRKAAS